MAKYKGILTLELLEDAKNYNQWIADEILFHIESPILEFGAGTGNLTKHFLTNKELYITDVDSHLIKQLKIKFGAKKNIVIRKLDVSQKTPEDLLNKFSTIVGINVLEHIENDKKALSNIHKFLKKNGKLVLLVPAKKLAYTKLDRELGHYRRYEKNEIIGILQNTKYKVEKIYYFNSVGLVSWIIRDKVKRKNVNLKPYHIRIFDSIVPLIRIVERTIRPPFGISLIVVARKI